MSSKENTAVTTVTASAKVAAILAEFKASRGVPTWKTTGIDRADIVAVLVESGEAVVSAWQENAGALAHLPGSLLKESVSAYMLTEAATLTSVQAMMSACLAGTTAETGDTLTDNARSAGHKAGQRIADLRSAISILEDSIPSQVLSAGDERVKAYKAARDSEHKPNADFAVREYVGLVVNGNTGLAGTYGKATTWVTDPYTKVPTEDDSEVPAE